VGGENQQKEYSRPRQNRIKMARTVRAGISVADKEAKR
jgi:hypothetical protein